VGGVELDLHQLDLRHRDLRISDVERRRRLIGSIAEVGQQVPVVVIAEGDRFVLIDGYLRVEALRRLHRDSAIATTWAVPELDALVHHRHLAVARRSALEDAWLLGRLREHGLSLEQLARRLCRSKSWVSHRLGLLDALAVAAQDRVRAGTVPPHGAMRYLVPFARANKVQCERMLAQVEDDGDAARAGLTMRPMQALLFGSPKAGTPLLVASPRTGLDLPLKALAWEADDGAVRVSINTPEYLGSRHGLSGDLLQRITGAPALVEEAAK
jgi:ParB-like chromosome segregation protein Spo0J